MLVSDPFLVCTKNETFCHYRLLIEDYNELFTKIDPKNNSVPCSEVLLNRNRMGVILNLVASSKALWDSANCDQCYDDIQDHFQVFSNRTNEFLDLHTKVTKCIDSSAKKEMATVCVDCLDDYNKLNIIYDRIKTKSENKICFDLEDKVS